MGRTDAQAHLTQWQHVATQAAVRWMGAFGSAFYLCQRMLVWRKRVLRDGLRCLQAARTLEGARHQGIRIIRLVLTG